ncbi:MAG: Rne/Rng family ribonuclease, partial [Nocardioidaceae bacterium]
AATKKAATKKAATKKAAAEKAVAEKAPAKKAAAKKTAKKAAAEPGDQPASAAAPLLFKAPEKTPASSKPAKPAPSQESAGQSPRPPTGQSGPGEPSGESAGDPGDDSDGGGGRRRRRRGGRQRRKGGDDSSDSGGNGEADKADKADKDDKDDKDDGKKAEGEPGSGRRRRRRRRAGEEGGDGSPDDPDKTVTRVRKARSVEDEITSLSGSTRLEAKKQRRREGREAGRRRAPIVSEAEFLARREAVERVMVIRQREDLTQIAVLEDKVLVEHYVARESQTSLIGNVYLGRVQNVLPSREAAFIDIGKGRNAVLYAGEVNWKAMGARDGQRKIEQVLKSGQSVLVQVTKDPIGHKGARLTSQISLPGRFLVYVPDGTTSGISRKLPDTERNRLKDLLKQIVPDTAGVIVRTAAEGASEQELTRDVERLTARWSDIETKIDKVSKGGKGSSAPQLLYGEPDLTLKVVRDLFTEDIAKLVVSGADAWDMVDGYVEHVAPDLVERVERYDGDDAFATYRIDEQIAKGLDRKVWLPSGGSLIIDRTEAMTVVDVNTGKFTGSGGNLEETVTKNNLEAAEEIVRQLRLRDIGGIIVVDFIDMVLESNRDLVMRRLVECLGRDRTRHQVAEVTSLGLVQMTRKRIGTGLLEAFSETCENCQGRGVLVQLEPVEPSRQQEDEPRRSRRGRNRGKSGSDTGQQAAPAT